MKPEKHPKRANMAEQLKAMIDPHLPTELRYILYVQKLSWLEDEHKQLWQARNGSPCTCVDVDWWQTVCAVRRETFAQFQEFLSKYHESSFVQLKKDVI